MKTDIVSHPASVEKLVNIYEKTNAYEKGLQEKVLHTTTAEQVYNPGKYQIMNTKSHISFW